MVKVNKTSTAKKISDISLLFNNKYFFGFAFLVGFYLSCSAQVVNIPDANFKNHLVSHFDANNDGEIQTIEAEAVFWLFASSKNINDVTGLEAFINVTWLNIQGNNVNSIDLSANTKIEVLFAQNNNLSEIDVSKLPMLSSLIINDNYLTTIDLSNNARLRFLNVERNQLGDLDVSMLANTLESLEIGDNPGATSFNLSGLSKLNYLSITNNGFTNLDLTDSPLMTRLSSKGNPDLSCVKVADPYFNWNTFSSVDSGLVFTDDCSNPVVVIPDEHLLNALLSHSPGIDTNNDGLIRTDEALAFTGRLSLSSMDIKDGRGLEAFVNITGIDLSYNRLFRLNLDANRYLNYINIVNNDLNYFSVKNGNNSAIDSLILTNNRLGCISVDNADQNEINWIYPSYISLSDDCIISFTDPNFKEALLDNHTLIDLNEDGEISQSEAVAYTQQIAVPFHSIRSLDGIDAFSNIRSIIASFNDIRSANFSYNTNLSYIGLNDNELTSLKIGDNRVIKSIQIERNHISELDLSSYTSLESLRCHDNQLYSLSVPDSLTFLNFGGNPGLSSFDFTNLINLRDLHASGNPIPVPNLSMLEFLGSFICQDCGIDNLDVSNNPNLYHLDIGNNQLDSLELSANNLLADLDLTNNNLVTLDLSNAPLLRSADLSSNNLTYLNANNGKVIQHIKANGNPNLSCISVRHPSFAQYYTQTDQDVNYYENCSSYPIEFIDANFKQAILNHTPVIDANEDGIILSDEAANFTGALDVSNHSIVNTSDIQFFDNASSINLSSNNIERFIYSLDGWSATTVDLSNNELNFVKLEDVANSNITNFIVNNNTNLPCINTDDPTYANAHWTVTPSSVTISNNCNVFIPDSIFKATLVSNTQINTNRDNEIQLKEAEAYSWMIFVRDLSVTELTGIEAFVNTILLDITNSDLSEVDLSRNTELITLVLSNNSLSEIDLTKNDKIVTLELQETEIMSLDLSNKEALETVNLAGTPLSNLNISNSGGIETLNISKTELKSIDVSKLDNLSELRAEESSLVSLDLSKNQNLKRLYARGSFEDGEPTRYGALTELLLPNPSSLASAELRANKIRKIIIPATNNLLQIDLQYNQLRDIEIQGINTPFSVLYLDHNLLSYINTSKVTSPRSPVTVKDNLLTDATLNRVSYVDLRDNPDLKCASVFDVAYATTSYDYDAGLSFSDTSCKVIWEEENGWNNITGPSATDDVLIAGNYDFTSGGSFSCADLHIHHFDTLIINDERTLEVDGEIRNDGMAIVESGASLITYEDNAFIGNDIEFRRNIRQVNRVSFVGIPVKQSSNNTGELLTDNNYVYRYEETHNYDGGGNEGLDRWVAAVTDELIPGVGYAQSFKQRLSFLGRPNNGTVSVTDLTHTIGAANNVNNRGWNLVSNPYPAAINAAQFLAENTNIDGSIALWDDGGSDQGRRTNSDYLIANAIGAVGPNGGEYNGMIGAMQGFHVRVTSPAINATVNFMESMRVSSENYDRNFFRKSSLNKIRLSISNHQGLYYNTLIGFSDEASIDYDRLYDAALILGNTRNVKIYTISQDRKLAIQGVPIDTEFLNLGITVPKKGEYTITMEEGSGYYLHDQLTNVNYDLSKPVKIFLNLGKTDQRYLLRRGEVFPLESSEVEDWKINVGESSISITAVSSNRIENLNIKLYDISGLEVANTREMNIRSGLKTITLNDLKPGIYIVKAESESSTLEKKVLIHQ